MIDRIVKLKTKGKVTVPWKLRIRQEQVFAEGTCLGLDFETGKFHYREVYYFLEDVEKQNPHFGEDGEPETIIEPTRRDLIEQKNQRTTKEMAEIEGFFKVAGVAITPQTGLQGGVLLNFKNIYPVEVKQQGYFQTSPEDWELNND